MPYIPQEQRSEIDVIVDPLVRRISIDNNYLVAKWLHYVILRIAQGLWRPQDLAASRAIKPPHDPLDGDLDPLIEMLNAAGCGGHYDEIVGRLNYALSCIMWRLCGYDGQGLRRYSRMNAVDSAIGLAHADFRKLATTPDDRMYAIDGAIGLAQCEFRRRIVAPYEDEKIESDGDI